MSAVETQIRNFCYKCNRISSTVLYCTKCGNGDLIPQPAEEFLPVKVEESLVQEVLPVQQQVNNLVEVIDNYVDSLEPEKPKPIPYHIDYDNRFHFLTGAGGTGKTFLTRQRAFDNPRLMELCSTTGIAAVNLGGRTINSVLKYYNTKSLIKNLEDGKLQYALRKVRQNKEILTIEECSMLQAEQLDAIVSGVDEINNDRSGKQLGVHLVGDFAQLPPVPEIKGTDPKFCFEAECWPRFQSSVEKLDTIYRQDNPDFIKAINFARVGDGNSAVTTLLDCGVRFEDKIDEWFNGTTLIAVNNDVDFYNTKRLNQLNTPMLRSQSKIEGTAEGSWAKLIPLELRVKQGAYVMILSNDIPDFNYVNGDTGWIRDYDSKKDFFTVELKRTGACVKISRITRFNLTDRAPNAEYFKPGFSPYIDQMTGDWVIGRISYHPLRLAYASTIHKSQGLSLDLVQINTSAWFFGHPGMSYVSFSRARTPEGLVVVGKPQDVAKKINCNPKVKQWI
jgi:PIF1-like helicase